MTEAASVQTAHVAGDIRTSRLGVAAFFVMLLVHLLLTTRNWSSEALPGHEFRQTQTAIAAYFIQLESNFSVAYPTPVLGKPWSIPMEFPLYQWSVVGMSNLTGLTLVQAARTVSLVCFYLMLPGLYRLLTGLAVAPTARWLTLTLVVSCPLYLFYTRAFMIESMALMLGVWFLAAYLTAMRNGRGIWLIVAAVAGAGAALVKVTTLMIWLTPAAVHGGYELVQGLRRGWRQARQVLCRGLLLAAGPCAAALWWVAESDRIKALNSSGRFLMSEPMRAINFSGWAERIRGDLWLAILKNGDRALMPVWLMGVLLLILLLLASRGRKLGLIAWSVFLGAQGTFPQLFAWHDYYFYAIGLFWLSVAGLALDGLAESPLGRRMIVGVVLLVVGVQLNSYRVHYYPGQTAPGNGGSGLTDALRALTPRESVLVVAGNDWSSVIPYYAQRRALMIRTSTENNTAYLTEAFQALGGEDVAALVVKGAQRGNQALVAQAATAFALDPTVAFSHQDTDVYLPRTRRDWVLTMLRDAPVFDQVVLRAKPTNQAVAPEANQKIKRVNEHADRGWFGHMSPMPKRYRFSYEPSASTVDGQALVMAHPDTELWFVPPSDMREIVCTFGILPAAYERPDGGTDGVEFSITERHADGREVSLYHRWLQPATKPGDRGRQQLVLPHRCMPGTELVFSTRPGGNLNYDWAYWGPITLR